MTENDSLVLNRMGVHIKGGEEGKSSTINQDDGKKEICFLLVPADTSSPLVELVVTVDAIATTSDPFMDLLEPYFQLRPGEAVNLSILEKQAAAEREAGCSTGMCPHVSPITLQRAAEAGTLEKVKISTSSSSDGSNSNNIYMYLDESANLKERPINPRAIQYAKANNYEDGDIFGDIFLARIGPKNNQAMSLTVQDMEKERWFGNSAA